MPTLEQLEEMARRQVNARIDKGTLSVKLLAHQINRSKPFASLWRNGHKGASLDTLDRILAALNVEVFTQTKAQP